MVTLGETEGEIDSHKVRIYDRDRTICDVLRNRNKMDREIFNKAVQGYVKDSKKNIPNLMEYAKVLHVQTILQAAIFETLQRRGTSYGRDSFKRVAALAENEDMQKRWKLFLKNIKENTLEFPFVIAEIRTFLEPVFDAIVNEEEWLEQWNFIMKWNKAEKDYEHEI